MTAEVCTLKVQITPPSWIKTRLVAYCIWLMMQFKKPTPERLADYITKDFSMELVREKIIGDPSQPQEGDK